MPGAPVGAHQVDREADQRLDPGREDLPVLGGVAVAQREVGGGPAVIRDRHRAPFRAVDGAATCMLQHVSASCSIGGVTSVAALRIVHSPRYVSIASRSRQDRVPSRTPDGATVPARRPRGIQCASVGSKFELSDRRGDPMRLQRMRHHRLVVAGCTRRVHRLDPSDRRRRDRRDRSDIPARERHGRRVRRRLRHREPGAGAAGDHRRRWCRHRRAGARRLGARIGRCRFRDRGRGRRECHRGDTGRVDRRHA